MTDQEAIEELKCDNEHCFDQCEGACASIKNYKCNCQDAIIERMLDELLQYRKIGTVEECQQAMEKAKSLDMYVKQAIWERDVAIQQLEEVGVSLGEKMDSVKEAVEKQKPKAPDYEGCYCSECVKKIRGSERNE